MDTSEQVRSTELGPLHQRGCNVSLLCVPGGGGEEEEKKINPVVDTFCGTILTMSISFGVMPRSKSRT